jgi:hypothetical protein
MRLKSAFEDFEKNTLGAVSGLLGRLFYVGRLQDGKEAGTGKYEHWGLTRVYGEDAAQNAIRTSHRMLLSEVLKKPMAALVKDALASSSQQQLTEAEFLAALNPPRPLSPSAQAHLRSVLSALSALLEDRVGSNLPGA